MNSSPAIAVNVPKQAKTLLDGQKKVSTYEATGGKATSQFASHNLTLIPTIPPGSVIHDNACGSGTVSRLILASGAPSDVKIHATDIDQPFLDVLQEDVAKHNWPVEVSNQRGEKLLFADETFTHSFTNIGIIFFSAAGLDGAKEIYRTLKPGGIAVVNCWQSITWFLPIMKTAIAFRGKAFPAPVVNWNDGQQIQKIMQEAGFEKEKTKVETSEAWVRTRDLRDWAEKAWAFLAGIGGWGEKDEEKWDEAVGLLVKELEEAEGTKVVDGEVWMRATQWVVVAEK